MKKTIKRKKLISAVNCPEQNIEEEKKKSQIPLILDLSESSIEKTTFISLVP